MANKEKDWKVFICYANVDNDSLAEPLAKELNKIGQGVWFDKFSISLSEDLEDKVHHGLHEAKGGIVIISESFIKIIKENPDKRLWTLEELSVLNNKKVLGNGFIIPIFYKTKITDLPKQIDYIGGIMGIEFKGGDSLSNLAMKIFEDIKKVRLKEGNKSPKRNWIIVSVLIIFIIFCLIFWNPFKNKTSPDGGITVNPPVTTTVIVTNTTTVSPPVSGNNGNNSLKVLPKPKIIVDDYRKYVNVPSGSPSVKTDVSIIISDISGNILNPVSNSIAEYYDSKTKNAGTGLLKNTFVKTTKFKDLFNGNSDMIDSLKLENYTKYLVIGIITYTYDDKGNGTFYCDASLSIRVFRTSDKSNHSFDIDSKQNGDTKEQAQEYALANLYALYNDKYL